VPLTQDRGHLETPVSFGLAGSAAKSDSVANIGFLIEVNANPLSNLEKGDAPATDILSGHFDLLDGLQVGASTDGTFQWAAGVRHFIWAACRE
jgi:hypothetical protein